MSAQLIVKFDLWDDPREQVDVRLAEIWMGRTGMPVLHWGRGMTTNGLDNQALLFGARLP